MESFGQRLQAARDRWGPLCVGIDPHAELLDRWGLPDDPDGLRVFTRTVIDSLADRVGVFKPQSAFFERFGSRGIAVLEDTIQALRAAGALVVLDVKRGDIGSTAQAYADAYLDPRSPLAVDAITASPYLGVGSLEPMFRAATAHGTGVFVLALTSNEEATELQRARTSAGPTVAGTVLEALAARNEGVAPLGSFGAVVGATIGTANESLEINGPLLAPGVGAQGGTVEDVARIFGPAARNVLPSTSRDVLSAGPSVAALREKVRRVAGEFAGLVNL